MDLFRSPYLTRQSLGRGLSALPVHGKIANLSRHHVIWAFTGSRLKGLYPPASVNYLISQSYHLLSIKGDSC
jgi:hypothetical protein